MANIESQNSLSTHHGVISYRLVRSSKRKYTVQVSIGHNGAVEVAAPRTCSVSVIEGFLQRKSRWLIGKMALFRQQELAKSRDVYGRPMLMYQGQDYPVTWQTVQDRWGKIDFKDDGWNLHVPGHIPLETRPGYISDFLKRWFKSRAQSLIRERVAIYSGRMEEFPYQIRIRSPKRLWGSCHPVKKVLHFNWKLVMAPLDVLDYVVVHELAHMKVADHSRRFWSVVAKFSPDYGIHKQWLHENIHRFSWPLE